MYIDNITFGTIDPTKSFNFHRVHAKALFVSVLYQPGADPENFPLEATKIKKIKFEKSIGNIYIK